MRELKDLWETEHGSLMWGMFVPGKSDHDRCHVRQISTQCILEGRRIPETWSQSHQIGPDGVEIDNTYLEIGHLINQLIKGNINTIWYVMSPVIIHDSSILQDLRKIVLENPSRAPYHSLKGMAISQLKDEIRRPRLSGGKGYRTAARTALFGSKLLSRWEFDFNIPESIVNLEISREMVETTISALDDAYDSSPYPDKPDDEPFRQFLYKLRMDDI